MSATVPAVRLDRVSKAFGSFRVLQELSLEVPAGHCAAIVGRSGTGKSVTLKHIVGLIKPDSGRVFVEEEEVSRLETRDLARARKRIGFLFQNAALFDSITVGENVMFPLRRHTDLPEGEMRTRARTKLAQVGLERDFDKMPAELSGGMRKRAGLARAMALDPPILLVDEPSAGLDPITSDEIDRLLLSLKQEMGTTIVLVTHHMMSARMLGDELIFIDGGRVLARGTAEALERSAHAMVRKFLETQGGG
ncbi:MAG: ATP-binding cassette domain-containing protein [Luteitalea sp.]|nr:ATP-binding cassette domain-containing protein [Luteitalea sp.]